MKTTTALFPKSLAEYFSNNPITPPFKTLTARAAKVAGEKLVGLERLTKDQPSRLVTIAARQPGLPALSIPWSVAMQSALCRAYPALDGLSIPAACIISPVHWVKSPAVLAELFDRWSGGGKNVAYRSASLSAALLQADPDRWYKVIISPDQRVTQAALDLVAAVPAFRVDSVMWTRFVVVSCPAWHPDALYPGLPIEELA